MPHHEDARSVVAGVFRKSEDEMMYGADQENADRILQALEAAGLYVIKFTSRPAPPFVFDEEP